MNNVEAIFHRAVEHGAKVIAEPRVVKDDHGRVMMASIQTYGDTVHTLIDRSAYNGAFLPGYRAQTDKDPISSTLPPVGLKWIDHCVGNQDWDKMEEACK